MTLLASDVRPADLGSHAPGANPFLPPQARIYPTFNDSVRASDMPRYFRWCPLYDNIETWKYFLGASVALLKVKSKLMNAMFHNQQDSVDKSGYGYATSAGAPRLPTERSFSIHYSLKT
jgi:hypothetical protein